MRSADKSTTFKGMFVFSSDLATLVPDCRLSS